MDKRSRRASGAVLLAFALAALVFVSACAGTPGGTLPSTTVSPPGATPGPAGSSTSQPPATRPPTTRPPTTQAPTTQLSTTRPPTTRPSNGSSPTTQPPQAGGARTLEVAAWSRGDLTSLADAVRAGAIGEVDTDWWHVRNDGSLGPDTIADPAYVTRAHAEGLKVFATVTNRASNQKAFDPALAEAAIGSSQARGHCADLLVSLCDKQRYDGIDIDFESLKQADRSNFSAFMAVLATRLHADGKKLSVAVYDKQTDYPTGPEAGARAAEDYRALGAVVDEFKVLTFGEHGSFTGPGPLASPQWTDRVLAFAESQVDPAKIYMGLPFFGFDWGKGAPRYLTWSAAQKLIAQYRPAVKRSPSGEPYFRYTASGVPHTVYFQDRTSIRKKVELALAHEPAIGGVAIWVMGIEDPGFWPVIGGLLP